MLYQKEIEIKYEVDVFVAGGGPAGVAAALAASREGKRVFLAEARGSFGGACGAGLVPSLATFTDGIHLVASGIGSEIRSRIAKEIPITARWTPLKVEEFKLMLDEIMAASTVRYSFFTTLVDVAVKERKVEYVLLSGRAGLFGVKAKVYIDCTGDGNLCALGGAQYEIGDETGSVMPATLCSLWANIHFDRRTVSDGARLEEAIADGVFTYADRHLPGMQCADFDRGIGGGNIGHMFDIDPEDEGSLTQAMQWGRRSMAEYTRYYRDYLTGFEDLTLVYTSDVAGIRESRRIKADHMLSLEDFLNRAVFDDEIGRYCYPVDIHVMNTDKAEFERFQKEYMTTLRYAAGESYGIPYRSLVVSSFDNVLVAGRCIGSDRSMQASVRVVPGCFITGQAAGVAAALAAESENVREISIPLLQTRLLALGAYLPNANV